MADINYQYGIFKFDSDGFNELRTIKTIAEAGSIQKAAARLQKNPSFRTV